MFPEEKKTKKTQIVRAKRKFLCYYPHKSRDAVFPVCKKN